MNICCGCRKEIYDTTLEICPSCGCGVIESDNHDFVDWSSEYDSNGF